jgi:hypothetical protein
MLAASTAWRGDEEHEEEGTEEQEGDQQPESALASSTSDEAESRVLQQEGCVGRDGVGAGVQAEASALWCGARHGVCSWLLAPQKPAPQLADPQSGHCDCCCAQAGRCHPAARGATKCDDEAIRGRLTFYTSACNECMMHACKRAEPTHNSDILHGRMCCMHDAHEQAGPTQITSSAHACCWLNHAPCVLPYRLLLLRRQVRGAGLCIPS